MTPGGGGRPPTILTLPFILVRALSEMYILVQCEGKWNKDSRKNSGQKSLGPRKRNVIYTDRAYRKTLRKLRSGEEESLQSDSRAVGAEVSLGAWQLHFTWYRMQIQTNTDGGRGCGAVTVPRTYLTHSLLVRTALTRKKHSVAFRWREA